MCSSLELTFTLLMVLKKCIQLSDQFNVATEFVKTSKTKFFRWYWMAGRRSPPGLQYASIALWHFPCNSVVLLQRRAVLELIVFQCVVMYLGKQTVYSVIHIMCTHVYAHTYKIHTSYTYSHDTHTHTHARTHALVMLHCKFQPLDAFQPEDRGIFVSKSCQNP